MPPREIELLAPAGKMEVLHSVVAAGADAVYLGGKRFNMRALREDYNFTDEEIEQAVEFLHQRNRKIYITVNNLYNSDEIDDIASYLAFLQDLGVDALIVQDLGLVDLCARMHLDIPLHASVQMSIANLEAVKVLENKGFGRVILSKNVSLNEIKAISAGTRLGIEYFVHGDLCISHTGQCYLSSFVSGESGNRGRCRKPCRWQYELEGAKAQEYDGYLQFLAHKDLCLYPYLPQMIDAGVSSFKIEGRMRSARFLSWLVATYRRALDRLMADPAAYETDEEEMRLLEENRIRDYTAGNLFEPLDRRCISFDGQREPVKAPLLEPFTRLDNPGPAEPRPLTLTEVPEISLRLGKLDGLQRYADLGVDNVILGSDQLRQNGPYKLPALIKEAVDILGNTAVKIFLETPRIVGQNDLEEVREIRKTADKSGLAGVVVNDLGSLNIFKDSGLELWGGYGLNIFNRRAVSLLQDMGISRVTASLEINPYNLRMLLDSDAPVELMVQGPLPGMVSDFCIIRAAQDESGGECRHYCLQDRYALKDRLGQKYSIYTDYKCRNHLLFPFDLCLFPKLPLLTTWGIKSLRIEGQYYNTEKTGEIVACYREGLQQLKKGQWQPEPVFSRLKGLFPEGLTAGLFTGF